MGHIARRSTLPEHTLGMALILAEKESAFEPRAIHERLRSRRASSSTKIASCCESLQVTGPVLELALIEFPDSGTSL